MKFFLNKRSLITFGLYMLFFFFQKGLIAQTPTPPPPLPHCVATGTPSYAWPTNSKWFFGNGVIGDFSGGTPSFSVLTGNTPPVTSYEGTASATDEAGNLLWFTNGRRVWDPSGNLIHEDLTTGNENDKDNGSSVQGVLITRHPLNPDVYHVFCTDDAISTVNEGLDYFTLDKSGVVLSGPTTIQTGWSYEGLSATLHINGIDVWVISQEFDNGNYNAYLIDCNGLNLAKSNLGQDMGIDFRGEKSYTRGALEFSWDGTKLAQGHPAAWPVGMQEVSLFDFNNSDGSLSGTIHFSSVLTTDEVYDIEFSNDNSKLYFTTKHAIVGVYDLSSGNAATITASMDTVGILTTYWGGSEAGIETAADGNIYINSIRESDLHVISGSSLNPVSVGSDLEITLGLPNNYLPPQDWVKIQDPGTLTDCDLPLDLETKWLCKDISAENTSGYENAYSLDSSCTGCSIDPVTGVFNAPGSGTYKVYFEICSIKDSITFTVGVCGCDADVSNSQPICVGETFLLDTAVISSSGTGVWTIDSVPSSLVEDAIVKYGVDSSSSETVLSFDGQNDYVNIDQLASYLTGNNFTVEFWINTQANNQPTNSSSLFFVNAPAPGDNEFGITMGEAGTPGNETLNVYDQKNTVGSKFVIKSSNDISGGCTHIAYVRNGSLGEAFVNGVSVGTHTIQYNITASHRVSFGQEWDGLSESGFFKGSMWDIAIWNTSRTSADIKNDLKGNLSGNEAGLIAYYDANQGAPNQNNSSENTLNDLSVNNLNGGLENFSLNGGASNFVYAPCKNIFDATPLNTKYGTYKLKYTVDNSCSDSMYIDVKKTPTVVIDSIGPFCDDSVAVVMTAIPANGGDVTGGWQIDNGPPFIVPNFDPVALGAGTYKVKYGVDSLGCVNTDSINVLVKERPVFSIDSIGPFCANDSAVTLTIQPSIADSGLWSGAVSDTSIFDPSLLTPGDTSVVYTISGQCGAADTINVIIDSLRDATITTDKNKDTLVSCVLDSDPVLEVNEFGGSWNNSAVVVNTPGVDYKIDLGILGSSKDTMLIYSLADPCGDSDTIWVTTTSQLSAAISQPDPICDTDSAINLIDSVVDLGGKFSGVGITDDTLGTFDPSVSGPGTHVIEYLIPGNCGDFKSVNIVVNATPNPEITNTDTVFCQNDSIINLTSTQSGGSWLELDNTFGALDTLKSEFKLDSSGTFKLQYGFTGQCPAYDTITLKIIETPTISFEPVDTLCDDASIVNIYDTVTVNPISSILVWTGDSDSNGKFNPNNNIGDNDVILTANNQGCILVDTLKIDVLERANAEIAPVPDFCANDTVSYSLSSVHVGQNGVWTGLGVTTGSIFKADLAGPGNHKVWHEISGKCGDKDSLIIKVNSVIVPSIDPIGPLCKGSDPFNLVATPLGGAWEDLGGGNAYVSPSGGFNPLDSGFYSFIYTISNPCKASDTVSVIINNVPTTRFSVTPGKGCAPLEVTFTDESSDISSQSLWDFGNNETSLDSSGTVTQLYSKFGCFNVTLTNSYSNGCSNDTTILDAVCTYARPKADFTWSPLVLDIDNNQALFDDLSIGNIAEWEWDFSDVVQPSQSSPPTTYKTVDPYYENSENPVVIFDSPSGDVVNVKLKVANLNGCSDSVVKPVTILDKFSVIVPNAFTPNNDGMNDEFFPKGRNLEFGDNYDFRIFNRWGTLIWKSKIPFQGWDGRVIELSPSSGQIAQVDIYVWRLIVVDPFTGEDYEIVGKVALML